MTYRGLAIVLLRCSGLISIVVGVFHSAGYIPMIWDVTWAGWGKPGAAGVVRTVLLPNIAGVVGGLFLFMLAGVLSRFVVRGVE